MTKSELYETIIDGQRRHGQGLSGIVRALGENAETIGEYLDELIEEGLIKRCETGGSLGHPESNRFYMPTTGYNVWEDEGTDGKYSRHKGRYLNFVRFYLGALEEEEGANDLQKAINPTHSALVKDPEFLKSYTAWLERNKEELEIMENLDPTYIPANVTFSTEELEFIQGKTWYKENKTIKECLEDSIKRMDKDAEIISINNKLIDLYKRHTGNKHAADLKKAERDIVLTKQETNLRKKFHSLLHGHDENLHIQEIELTLED